MSKTVSQLAAASTPILGTDQIVISRDGNVLLKTTLADLPVSTAVQAALSEVITNVLTTSQKTAGGVGAVGLTSGNSPLGLDGKPLPPFTAIDPIANNYTVDQDDNNKIIDNIVASQITIPSGLVNFTLVILPPVGGSVTIIGGSGVTLNNVVGATLTRSSANAAVQIIPTSVADSYRVTGI